MPDREKVIKGIDICLQRFHCGNDCPYYNDAKIGCEEQLREDAIALLKEQEAVEPNSVEKNSIFSYGVCPSCGKNIDTIFNPVACGYCGQAVKWEC